MIGPGGSDPPAPNYRSTIRSIVPPLDGLQLRIIDAGARVELVNHTGEEVVVLGYDGEPYLRIGPDGVFDNRRSPATYPNQDGQAQTNVPPQAGAGTVLLGALPILRRVPRGAFLVVTVGAAGFGLLGVTGLDWLTRSQIASGLDPALARATVIASTTEAVGVLTTAATRLPSLAAATPRQSRQAVSVPHQEPVVDLRRELTLLIVGLAVVLVLLAFAVSGDPNTGPTSGNGPWTQEGP